MSDCIFCKIAGGDIPSATLYEDDDFRVILDLGPATKGHALILPKHHYANPVSYTHLALLAFALPVMVLLHRQQKEKEHKKEEQQQMQQDYPEIVTKLQLLLSTGMNLRKSVERIAGDYVSYMRREEAAVSYTHLDVYKRQS